MKNDKSVQFEKFKPAIWAPGVHLQTIISSFSKIDYPQTAKKTIETPDDDFLELEVINLENKKPVVALFHGLEGSSQRHYIQNLMYDLRNIGYSSVALNFRGCGSRINKQRRMYHSGETADYFTLFDWMAKEFEGRKIYAVGFSLGANALIKSLAEKGENHPVAKAVAVSPPYDLKKGSINMSKGFNKIYEKRFLRTLSNKAKIKQKQYRDFPTFNGNTVYDFDDQVTAPIHGFENADDYYDQCSSKHFYKDVKTSLLVIHSKADTLCPLQYAPFQDIEDNQHIRTLFTESGGHVGFISRKRGWLNRSIIKWLNG